MLIVIAIAVVPIAVHPQGGAPDSLSAALGVLVLLVLFALAVPNIAICVRRLHDANMSGALWLLNLILYVGGFILLILTLMPSQHAGARFGRAPTS